MHREAPEFRVFPNRRKDCFSVSLLLAARQRSGMNLRVCTQSVPYLLGLDQNGQVVGFMAGAIKESNVFFSYQFNVTNLMSDKIGEIVDGSEDRYDGCLGLIQRNLSDTLMPNSEYPTLGPGLVHSRVTGFVQTAMVNAYNNTFTRSDTDVMDAFASFSHASCLVIVAMNIMLACIMICIFVTQYSYINHMMRLFTKQPFMTKRTMVRKAASKTLALANGCFLKQHSAYEIRLKRPSFRLTLLLWSILMFLVSLFFASLIKTDVVLFDKPDTISSYADLLAHPNMRPVWSRAMNEHQEFAYGKKGSPQRQIWERAVRMGMNESRVDLNVGSLRRIFRHIQQKLIIWFVPGYATQAVITNFCSVSRSIGVRSDMNMWIRTDPDARLTLRVLMRRSAMPARDSKILDRLITSVFEHRLRTQVIKQMEYALSPYSAADDVRECVANKIMYPDHGVHFLAADHYHRLLLTVFVMMFVSGLILLIEFMSKTRKPRQ